MENHSSGAIIKVEEDGPQGPFVLFGLEDHLRDQHNIRGANPPIREGGSIIYGRRGDFGATILFFALSATFSAAFLTYVFKLLREAPGDYKVKLSVDGKTIHLEVQKKATPAENLEQCLNALVDLGQDRAEIVAALVALGYHAKALKGGK